MSVDQAQADLFAPTKYERLALTLRAVSAFVSEPTADHKSDAGKALKDYQTAWIRHHAHGVRGDEDHADRILARLAELAAAAIDGSLLDANEITAELRETLDRLATKGDDDPPEPRS